MIRKLLYIAIFAFFLQTNFSSAGTTGSEELKGSTMDSSAPECFEGFSRVMFKFNYALDGAIFEPVAKGYRTLPVGFRKGTSNVVNNLRSLLTLSNNLLQGDFRKAGDTAGRLEYGVLTVVAILFFLFSAQQQLETQLVWWATCF